jgi:hypothetical protein
VRTEGAHIRVAAWVFQRRETARCRVLLIVIFGCGGTTS